MCQEDNRSKAAHGSLSRRTLSIQSPSHTQFSLNIIRMALGRNGDVKAGQMPAIGDGMPCKWVSGSNNSIF